MSPVGKRELTRLANHQYLLQDPDVRRWYENLNRGAATTSDGYLRRMSRVVKDTGLLPKQMTRKYRPPKAARNFLLDLVGRYEREGKKPSNIRNLLKPVRSWFSHMDIQVHGRIKTGNTKEYGLRPFRIGRQARQYTSSWWRLM